MLTNNVNQYNIPTSVGTLDVGRPDAKCVTTIPDVGQIKTGVDDTIPPGNIHTYKIYIHIHGPSGKCVLKMAPCCNNLVNYQKRQQEK